MTEKQIIAIIAQLTGLVAELRAQVTTTFSVVVNRCYGGFGLSPLGEAMYLQRTGREFDAYDVKRHDPDLVAIVEQLGRDADGSCANLVVKRVPSWARDLYVLNEYDGIESVVLPIIDISVNDDNS